MLGFGNIWTYHCSYILHLKVFIFHIVVIFSRIKSPNFLLFYLCVFFFFLKNRRARPRGRDKRKTIRNRYSSSATWVPITNSTTQAWQQVLLFSEQSHSPSSPQEDNFNQMMRKIWNILISFNYKMTQETSNSL